MRVINLWTFIKNLFLTSSYPEEIPLSEADRLLGQIEDTKSKIDYAWDRLNYAAPEYVEIAVLDLLVIETQYELLFKRYRLLLGINDEPSFYLPSSAKALSYSMVSKRQNHPVYDSLFNPKESSSLDALKSHIGRQHQYH